MHQHATLEDTVYFWFAANDTSGSGGDGASPVYDVRLGGAAAGAIPTLSGSATLLSHANYAAGCHEIAVAATDGNGFAAGNTYGVFCTLLVDSQNPTGFVGSFTLGAAAIRDAIFAKTVNGVTFESVSELVLADVGGQTAVNTSAGTITIYKQDGTTPKVVRTYTGVTNTDDAPRAVSNTVIS